MQRSGRQQTNIAQGLHFMFERIMLAAKVNLANIYITVAILAQGTSWAVAVTQAYYVCLGVKGRSNFGEIAHMFFRSPKFHLLL